MGPRDLHPLGCSPRGSCAAFIALALGCGGGGETLGSIGAAVGDAASDGPVPETRDAVKETSPTDAALGPFGAPVLVTELADPNAMDEDPTFTEDLLEIYFTSDRGGNLDIWRSERALPTDRWRAPTRVAELSAPETDQTPSISLDGLTIWITSGRPGSKRGTNIWVSTRASRASAWPMPTEVTELSSDGNEVAPATDENDLLMAFASDRAGGTAQDIYFSARPDKSSPWSPPVLVPRINSTANDWDPFLGDHALQIFFNSDRGGMAGDLYLATRSSPTATFGPVLPLTECNSPANDTDPTLSRDLRYIMFGSNRSGNPEIYEARR
jgi:hypothetical protein